MVGMQIAAMSEAAAPISSVKCEPSNPVPKKKKKKPSAIRDFPFGCGRYAAPIIPSRIPTLTPTAAHEEEEEEISVRKQPEISASPHTPRPVAHLDERQQQNTMLVETSIPSSLPSSTHEEEQHLSIAKYQENAYSRPQAPDRDKEQQMPIAMKVEDGLFPPHVASPHVPPVTAEIPMCLPASISSGPANFTTLSVSAVREFPTCSTSREMPMCPLLTQPASPSTAPIKFPKRFVSTVRDFPFGCGRNAPPTTREECLRAVAAVKASKTPTKQQPITPPPLTFPQAEASSVPDPKTAENEQDLIPKDNEATPIPPSEDSEVMLTPPSEKPGNIPDEDNSLPDRQALMVSTDHNTEISQGFMVNDKIVDGGTNSKMVSTDCSQSHPELESSKTCKVNRKTANCGTTVLRSKKNASPPQKQKHKVESVNFADSQANKVDDQLDLAPKTSKESPKYDISGVKVEEENLAYGQALIEPSPNPLQSQSKPKRSHNSRVKVKTDNGGTSVNTSKNKSQHKLKPKVRSVNFALTPFDGADGQTRSDIDGMVTRAKVRETMRLFQVLYRKFLQEEENHPKQPGQGPKRPDIMAAAVLKENNKYLNTGDKIVGNVPGVEVGDEFHYRIELMIVGLHGQSQGGIDYLKQGKTIIATSIVASGGYADNDEGEVLVYSGQGGNDKKGKQNEDQKLERGNLALKNCIAARSPVRVIRGFKDSRNSSGTRGGKDGTMSKTGTTYTYDGLYIVETYQQEAGTNGFSVFKFQLRRMPGQPELAWNIVKSVGRSRKGAPREGLCLQDISQGKETRPICVVNTVDDEAGPAPFEYTAKIIYPSGFNPPPPRGCDCVDGCSDSEKCLCAVKNGGELPYNYNGSIVEAKSIVYECSTSCKCPPTCHNKVSQHGVRINLEIFKTERRGWGVRSLSSISSGSFICEYTGELLSDMEAEQRTGNDEYLFDIGRSSDQSLWDGLSGLVNELPSHSISETVEDAGYTIDAAKYGSVGRFINHSCSPNLYAQNVLYDHDDKNVPHIMLFAAENIPPLQELCYHYNYNPDSVQDSDGNIKKKSCYCGSAECTGRLY